MNFYRMLCLIFDNWEVRRERSAERHGMGAGHRARLHARPRARRRLLARDTPELARTQRRGGQTRDQPVATAGAALAEARASGVRTIVDCTTFDLGRDAGLLAEVSRASGVAIIASSGVWLDPSVTVRARTVGQLADWFIHDLLEGLDGTSVRAGVIKIATEEAIGPDDAKILQAAGIAGVETSAPIITHTAPQHRSGEAQAALLESCGVDPRRVAIGHSDDSDDLAYLTGLASRGYWISMDRLPHGRLPEYGGQTVQDRIEMIGELIEE